MKRLLLVAIVGLLLGADDAKKEQAGDAKQMAGVWSLVSAERDGQPAPEEFVKSLRREVKDDEYALTRDGETLGKGKFKVDSTTKPKTIDFMPTEGNAKGMTMLGIYELTGDNLKVCYAAPGKDRPKEFSAPAGSGNTLSVWKREKK